jgi:hypothetical protein
MSTSNQHTLTACLFVQDTTSHEEFRMFHFSSWLQYQVVEEKTLTFFKVSVCSAYRHDPCFIDDVSNICS